MESEVAKINENAPYLIMLTSDEGYQFNVVVERNILPHSGRLTTAILDLFSAYYTFNMYPRPFHATMIFLYNILFLALRTIRPYPTWPQWFIAHSSRFLFEYSSPFRSDSFHYGQRYNHVTLYT